MEKLHEIAEQKKTPCSMDTTDGANKDIPKGEIPVHISEVHKNAPS